MTTTPCLTTLRRLCLCGLLSGLLCSGAVFAQSKRKLAYTDPDNAANADADFAYQGEYLGVYVEKDTGKQVGLQVVARGDGKFLGVEYLGGLPGTGWNRRDRTEMQGTREDGYIYFSSERYQYYVSPERAYIYDMDAEKLGELPPVVRISPTMGRRPPAGAVVLFDGTDTSRLKKPRITPDGLLMEGTQTTDAYGDFTLHLEFRLPYMPFARGQGRANSGVYLQSRYEVQVLDSFGLQGKANECGGLYRQREPDQNMCLPPLQWQTYDITLRSPKFNAEGEKIQNARITVRHNGVLIHDDVELTNKTGAGRPEGPHPLPTKLQNHGNPVRFRNIWLLEGGDAGGGSGDGTSFVARPTGSRGQAE